MAFMGKRAASEIGSIMNQFARVHRSLTVASMSCHAVSRSSKPLKGAGAYVAIVAANSAGQRFLCRLIMDLISSIGRATPVAVQSHVMLLARSHSASKYKAGLV